MSKLYCEIPLPDGVLPTDFIDTLSYIRCKELTLIDCGSDDCNVPVVNNGLYLCDCSDSWNCNLCANDLPFFNLVNLEDKIYFQFQQIDNVNGQIPGVGNFTAGWDSGFARAEIYDCCNDQLLTSLITSVAEGHVVGLIEEFDLQGNPIYTNYQALCLDVQEINELFPDPFDLAGNCFYIKFFFINNPELGTEDEICSEPFRINPCQNKIQTTLIKGVYPKSARDCFGYYYGGPLLGSFIGIPFDWSSEYRVRGVLEKTGIEINKDTVTRRLRAVNSEQCELYRFATFGVPEVVAGIIANLFGAQEVYLNNKLLQLNAAIEKNNEIGNQWFIETEFKRCDCFRDFGCD